MTGIDLGGQPSLTADTVPEDAHSRRRRDRHGAAIDEIAAVYAESAPRLRRVAAGILADADAAQDVVQEAFARAIRKRTTFKRTGSVEAWLWRVVVNTALNRRRADAAETAASRRLDLPEQVAGFATDHAHVRKLVAALPDRQRAALFLHYYADLDYHTIARILGIRNGTVGKLLHDARTAIREEVDQ